MKPPVTRQGRTHKVTVGTVTMYLTVNKSKDHGVMEIFGKADEGLQGHVDMACRLVSLALQKRGDVETLIRHMRGDRTEPCGIAGQPTSIYDALSKILELEHNEGKEGQ